MGVEREGAGSVTVSGPFTAGFTEGAAALNSGRATNELHVRIVNTSGGPVRLSADDDQATRLVIDYRTASPNVPWGLVGGHGDHLSIEGEPLGWVLDGTTLRRVVDAVWSPGDPLDFTIELHTSALAHHAQLILRFEDLPDGDDTELVLLVDVGPLAVHAHRTATINPIEMWGGAAQIDFTTAEPSGDLNIAARASVLAAGNGALRVAAEWLQVVDRSLVRWQEVNPDRRAGDEPSLELRVSESAARIESRGDLPLRLNADGNPVTIGYFAAGESPAPPPAKEGVVNADTWRAAALTVSDTLRVSGGTHDGRTAQIQIAVYSTAVSIQTDMQAPLRINPAGNSVEIGSRPQAPALTVRGQLDVVGPLQGWKGTSLVIHTDDDYQDFQVALGVDTGYGWIQSRWSGAGSTAPGTFLLRQTPLRINPGGGSVGIGEPSPIEDVALTVGGRTVIIDRSRESDNQIGSLAIRKMANDEWNELRLGIADGYSWIAASQSDPVLRINPRGGRVDIGQREQTGETGGQLPMDGRDITNGWPAALAVGDR